MEIKSGYILNVSIIVLYLTVSVLLLFSPLEFSGLVSAVVNLYMGFGFDLDVDVARALIIFLFVSCCVNLFLVIVGGMKSGWPEFKGHNSGTMLYCLLKLVLVVGFCVLVLGALGDNISARNISIVSKTISELIGALILGGWVWVANDFVGAVYTKYTRSV